MRQKEIFQYTVKFESDDEGGYMVTVPAFPEITTGGRTLAEAEAMAKEAIGLCIEYYTEQRRPLPKDIQHKAVAKPHFFELEVAHR